MSKSKMTTSRTDEATRVVDDTLPRADATMEELEQWIFSLGGRELSPDEIRARDKKVAGGSKRLNECPFDTWPATTRVAEAPEGWSNDQ
jgi:hypothetical protein